MAKRTRTNMEIQIPVELIMEILVKLPAKSLFRFHCVSKLWCSLISDPHFVEAHHALSSGAHPRLFVFFPRRCEVKKISNNGEGSPYKSKIIGTELYSMNYTQHSDCVRQTLYYRQSICIPATANGEISQPVHSLYCLDFHDRVRIWNPTTLESLDIKIEEVEICPCSKFDVTNHFGFDPVDKKHKILSISRLSRGRRPSVIESRVFVLEENCWRKLSDCPPDLGLNQIQEVVCIDGIIYSIPYGRSRSLVAFHVRSERFQRIPIPGEAWRTMLIEFAGRATLSDTYDLPDKEVNEINLWILEDLEHRTWTRKTCVIRLGEDCRDRKQTIALQGATPAGELLLAQRGFSEPFLLLLYHVESDTLRTIELRGIPPHLRLLQHPFDSWTRVLFHEDRLQELPLKLRLGSRLVAE